MANSISFYSKVDRGIYELLSQRAGNNDPKQLGGVSGLKPWIRIVSAVKSNDDTGDRDSGLVLDSYDGIGSFASRYGTRNSPGILGYKLDLQTPVSTEEQGRGLRPRPLLTNFSIDEFTIGTRKVDFEITCFSLEQLETLSKYLGEIRFNLLFEWGWNTSKSRSVIAGGNKPIEICDIVKYDQFSYIQKKRRDSDFQYDAFLGVITNYEFTLGENETFILKVKCTGIGETAQYLQLGRGETQLNDNSENSSLAFNPTEIKEFIKKDYNSGQKIGSIGQGKALFAQFFNQLPNQKRFSKARDLINNPRMTDPANFINVDETVRDKTLQNIKNSNNFVSEGYKTKISDGIELENSFTDEKFVRLEVLVEVLNTLKQDISALDSKCGKGMSKSYKISIDDTIIRAFPYMFSTKKDILYIPNAKAPNLGLTRFFKSEDIDSLVDFTKLDEESVNLHPKTYVEYGQGTQEAKNGSQTPYAFPSTYDLTPADNPINEIDETFIPLECVKGKWGYLKNLYVNLDYFNSVITKSNYIARDIWFDLLNGISSACLGLWDFQIVNETPTKELTEARVYDMGFTGTVREIEYDDYEIQFPIRGVDSPFLTFEMTTESSKALTTQVIFQSRGGTRVNTDQNNPGSRLLQGTFFSNFEDQVGTNLIPNTDSFTSSVEQNDSDNKEKNIAIDYLNGKVGVYPLISNPLEDFDITSKVFDLYRGDDRNLEDIFVTATCDDVTLLSFIKELPYSESRRSGKIKMDAPSISDLNVTDLPIGSATVTFTIHGIGGFKVGDRLRFKGLPKKFTKNFIYYVTKVSHTIDDTTWTTTIEAKSKVYVSDE